MWSDTPKFSRNVLLHAIELIKTAAYPRIVISDASHDTDDYSYLNIDLCNKQQKILCVRNFHIHRKSVSIILACPSNKQKTKRTQIINLYLI